MQTGGYTGTDAAASSGGTHANLISSNEIEGARVYGTDGQEIGHIDHLMIDKISGRIAYAVMGFGGFLGIGEDQHPIPWAKLSYSLERDGYVTDLTEAQLKGAPERGETWYRDRDWHESAYLYYGVPPYWI